MFKLQAACPFWAFAETRLGAEPLPSPSLGIDAPSRGDLLHKSLRYIWARLKSKEALDDTPDGLLREVVHQASSDALSEHARKRAEPLSPAIREIEQERMEALLLAWLELERERTESFEVAGREQEREISLGGLTVKTFTDRVDVLRDGRSAIVDYKVTAPSPAAWSGPRPDEPQLPLYAVSENSKVAGVAFAQLKPGDLKFSGFTDAGGLLPGVNAFHPNDKFPASTLAEQIGMWRTVLSGLAEAYRKGNAEVDPKKYDTCDRCHLHALCRIGDAGRPDDNPEVSPDAA